MTELGGDLQHLSTICANLTIGIAYGKVITDGGGRLTDLVYLDMNQAYERMMGIMGEEAVGRRATEVFPELNDTSDWIAPYTQAAHDCSSVTFERNWPDEKWYSVTVSSLKTGHFVEIIEDISERKRAEKSLAESEAKFRQIFNSTYDAIFVADLQGRFLEVNDAACQQVGYTREELLRMGPAQITPSEIAPLVPVKMAGTEERGQLIFESAHLTKDGRRIPIEISTRMITFQGTPAVLGVVRDITNRKLADVELRNTLDRFYQILSDMPYGILLVTDDEHIEFANLAFCDLFDLEVSPDHLIDLPKGDVLHLIRDKYGDPNSALARIEEILSRDQPVRDEEVVMRGGRTLLRDYVPIRIGGRDYGRMWIHIDITERKEAEEALRLSEEKFAKVFYNNSANMVLARVSDGAILDVNDSWLESTGFTRDELYGKSMLELGVWEQPKLRDQFISDIKKNGSVRGREYEFVRKDGSRTVALMSGQLLNLHRDELILSSSVDITKQKEAEEALRESEEKFAKAFYGSTSAKALSRMSDGMYVDVNDRWLMLTGYQRDEVIGHTSTELGIWASPKRRDEVMRDLERKGAYHDVEIIFLRKGGKAWTALASAQILNLGGERFVLASFLDISDRKRMEKQAEEERSRLQSILDSLPVGVSVADANGQIIIRNRIMHNFLGEAARSKSLSDLSQFRVYRPGSDTPLPAEEYPIARALLRGEVLTNEELEVQVVDGSRMIVLASALPIYGHDGKIAGSLVVFTDISRLKVLENDLKRSNAELQQFAYVASHDLKSPLTTITGFLYLLQSRYKGKVLDERASGFIDQALSSSKQMAELIDDLLEYSKIDRGNGGFEPVDMNTALDQVRRNLAASISKTSAIVTNDPLPTVVANGTQMEQLLQNLISNAIKFHAIDTPRIHVSAEEHGDAWQFSVRDNGIGIDPIHHDGIFQMFSRLHTRSEYEGTGIGLASVKRIVERHGGKVWFESEEGQGSTFFFTIPVR